jgi:hypothetical protein
MPSIQELLDSGDIAAALAAAAEDHFDRTRRLRAELLAETDYTQLPDTAMSDAKKAEWAAYRQALRDLPQTYSSATSFAEIIFPTKPS